jgi:parallel beta-helix repeat protein
VALIDNDIAYNNSAGYFDVPGSTVQCGCSGGGKFWQTTNGTVTGNYVHNNIGVGIWVDTDNAGFNISSNYVSNNWAAGIMYEISYNAQINNNTLVGNTISEGSSNATPGFPDGAIYISESGGDTRVASQYAGQFLVQGNLLTNNWGGVVLWENADRYCSDGSDGVCTLVDPSTYTMSSCAANLSGTTPFDYYDNCRWKTQNVQVTNNTENIDPASVAANCTVINLCGFSGLFSNYGTSIYGSSRPIAVTFHQGNTFADNTYNGPWSFFAWSQSNLANPVAASQWMAPAPTDDCASGLASGTCSGGFGQDAGSQANP